MRRPQKIDKLYQQLHRILETQRFNGRLVLAMGSAYNVGLLQKYLSCYSLGIQAVLDNDPRRQGLFCGECKIFRPEEILKPFKDKALILIYSPGYAQQMKQQLISLGYQENIHFFILEDFRQPSDSWRDFFRKTVEAVRGMSIYRNIQRRYGKDTQLFILRGATGDVFLNGLYLDAYAKRQNIHKYVLAGDAKGLSRISALFGFEHVVPLNFEEAECLQYCYQFFHCERVTDVFMWQGSLHFNRCQTRMHREFHFLDTYTYYIYKGLVGRDEWKKPNFQPLTKELERKYHNIGLKKGRTVIVAPFAYSVVKLSDHFWDQVAERLKKKGYEVFVSINPETEVNPFNSMESFFFSFQECQAALTYCGYFLALRSGLCDIVSMIPCKQVLLYPDEMSPLNYRVHRSDMVFSGFSAMGFEAENITEISSPVIRDIMGVDGQHLSGTKLSAEYESLVEKVESQFEPIE